jgi:hypothetical protein
MVHVGAGVTAGSAYDIDVDVDVGVAVERGEEALSRC